MRSRTLTRRVCDVCGPIGVGLKVWDLTTAVNEGITLSGHLWVHDVYINHYFARPSYEFDVFW